MEERDLYDENKNLTGETIFKGDPIPENRYIIVVMVIIQNSKKEFLIQKRSAEKNGKFAFTGGHPKAGETSIQGMITEIKEELGLDISETELDLFFTGRNDKDRVFFDMYYLKKDFEIEDLKLQKEEVDYCEWDSSDRVRKLINDGLFHGNHVEEFYRLIDIYKKRGIEVE